MDNLVIFGRAELEQIKLFKEILDNFCGFFGHRINARKTNVFFSKRVEGVDGGRLCGVLCFRQVQNLGFYLGVPLFHERITNSSLRFVVEKVKAKLQQWDARQLSLASRIALAQSVLLAIPRYFMQSLMIPKGICEEIGRIARHFIWEFWRG